ncbi:CAP-Gly domain-containing linker protein 3-like isoform X2 [Macrobrachium nipponense]|uniref:CAP-Gly domain-containing linker protein 3-like isoform X2 n=1 Tax=Macrobrachium nipponense TaxID=159736 RepID=UPI0030C7AF4B
MPPGPGGAYPRPLPSALQRRLPAWVRRHYPPPPAKFAQQREYPPGYDSDSNSDHSSSGRGSGGSDVGSEVDREGSRLEDSGRYSADGCESISPTSSQKQISSHIEIKSHVDPTSSVTTTTSSVTIKTAPQIKNPSPVHKHVSQSHSPAHSIQSTTQSKVLSGGKNGQEVAVTHSRSSRSVPVTHPPVDAPLCSQCNRRGLFFFDPGCSGCSTLLRRPTTSPSHVFAVMRQWVPQVQHNIHQLVAQALSLGCHVDDRDGLSDMTLLHYAVKAGSNGVGDPVMALKVVKELLRDGADVHQRCRWTHMTALHYAAYFDVAPVLDLLLSDSQGVSINDACLEYSGGTPLHIAAANLCLAATKVLLAHGAPLNLTDTQGRTPFQCIPAPDQYELVPDVQNVIAQLRSLLCPSAAHCYSTYEYSMGQSSTQGLSGRAVLKAMGLKLGDRVLVSGVKTGTLRFVGSTEFATGLWAGVELETPSGRHNGTVKGVMYFRCANNYGIFVPVNRLTKIPNVSGGRQGRSTSVAQRQRARDSSRRSVSLPPGRVNHGRVDVSRVSSRVAQDIRNTNRKIVIGDRVYVDMGIGNGSTRAVMGVVRYTGGVHFASGFWIGVELEIPRGTNDGSVNGSRYFTCRPNCGIFAAPSRVIKVSSDYDCDEGLPPSEPSSLSYSRFSLGSGHGSNNNILSTGPVSLGYSTSSMSYNTHGPSSLGFHSAMNGANNHPMCSSMTDSCSKCVSSQHLLDGFSEGALKRANSLKTAIYPPNTAMTSLNRSFSARYVSSRQRQEEIERAAEEKKKEQTWCDPPVLPTTKAQKKKQENEHWLEPGHNVFYKNEVGVIKYIGQVDFEPGVWLGIELRKAKGRHDGVVKGKRYFTCRPRHGIMVKPSKVYVRGINGAKLVRPDNELEE